MKAIFALIAGAVLSTAVTLAQLPTPTEALETREGFSTQGFLCGSPNADGTAVVLVLKPGTYHFEAKDAGGNFTPVPVYIVKDGLRRAFASGVEFKEVGQYKLHVLAAHRKGFRAIRRLDENGK